MEAKMKKTVAVTRVVPQPMEAMWKLIRSGADIHRMLPGVIESCRLEGSGAGARRYCGTKQGMLEETILAVDDEARLFRYSVDRQSMLPTQGYEGSLHVVDLGPHGTQVLWFATYELLDQRADEAVREALRGMFTAAIGGMGALVASGEAP